MQNHHQGIGKKLIENIEDIAINIGCKELIIPASVYACEFYRKFGFDYLDDKKMTKFQFYVGILSFFVYGGDYRSRTDHQSFADSCLTAWLSRQKLFF